MQILIDIPEHVYEHAKEMTEDSRDEFDAMRAIANGTQQESCSEIPSTCNDAISRQAAIRAIEALQLPIMREASTCYQFKFSGMSEAREAVENLPSVTPQSCGDAISRQAVLDIITFEDKWLFDANGHNANTHIAFSGLKSRVKALPSVTPQQRAGWWIKQNYGWNWQCSECGFVTPPSAKEIFTFCPKCGCKMEVEE